MVLAQGPAAAAAAATLRALVIRGLAEDQVTGEVGGGAGGDGWEGDVLVELMEGLRMAHGIDDKAVRAALEPSGGPPGGAGAVRTAALWGALVRQVRGLE